MAITLKKVLTLPIFQECCILSGENDLNRPVYRVTVIEMPLNVEDHELYGRPGDFNLTALYAYKDHPEKLIELITFLVEEKSAVLCYIDSYYKQLPDDVIAYANQHNFPIIRIAQTVPYANIISGIMEMIIRNQDDAMLEHQFKNLMDSSLIPSDIRSIVYGINESFKEIVVALMIRQKNGCESTPLDFRSIKLTNPEYTVSSFDDKILVVLTFSKFNISRINRMIDAVVDTILESQTILNIGISATHLSLEEIRLSLLEALEALEASSMVQEQVIYYEKMGILKFLIPLRFHDASKNFANHVVNTLTAYDQKHNALLMDTAIQYVACNCDVKKTAYQMTVHENTIRYRIDRMRELFEGCNSSAELNELLAIALKLYRLIQ